MNGMERDALEAGLSVALEGLSRNARVSRLVFDAGDATRAPTVTVTYQEPGAAVVEEVVRLEG